MMRVGYGFGRRKHACAPRTKRTARIAFLAALFVLVAAIALAAMPFFAAYANAAGASGTAGTAAATEADLVIAATSDLHGHIDPVDYFMGTRFDGGLAQISIAVGQLRTANKYVLLIDNGDTIEGGNSVMPYHLMFDPQAPNPMALVMDYMNYDAATIGNHEFNYGLGVLAKYIAEARFPVLSANIVDPDGRPAFVPYVIKNLGPFKVGILGLTTPKVPVWEKPDNIPGLTFIDPAATARKYVPEMRANGADVIVIAAHTGFEKSPRDTRDLSAWQKPDTWAGSMADDENFTLRLANEVPGVDVIIAGHQHLLVPEVKNLPGTIRDGVVITEPGYWGQNMSVVRLHLARKDNNPGGAWRVASAASETPSLKGVASDPAVEKLAQYYNDQTTAYFSKPLGTATADMPGGLAARFYHSALIELINAAQLWATDADISLAALFSESSFIARGPITIQDIYRLYIYPNTLYKIQITGAQLKDALEYDAHYFKTYAGQTSLEDMVDPGVRGYNWDVYAGIDYEIDLTKPLGQRVVELKFKGEDVRPDQVFTLALNNYRAGGGGGFTMFRGAPILWQSTREVREIIVDYVKAKQGIDPATLVDHNWSLIPEVVKEQ